MIHSSKPSALLLSLIGGVFLCGLSACSKEETKPDPVRPVMAMKLADSASVSGRSFPGRAAATEEVNMSFEVAGTVIERPVNKGDEVKKGQFLARLDPRDFENELKATEAERDRAKAHRDRIAKAAAVGAVAQQDLTDAEAALRQAEAAVEIKAKAVQDSKIYAPFDGFISATYVERFQTVQVKQKVLRLLDISKIEVTIDIPESGITLVPYAKDIKVVFDAFEGREFPAELKEIGTEASDVTRTYPVTVILDQPGDAKILPGMACNVSGRVERPKMAGALDFTIPLAAVFADEKDNKFVWVIDDKAKTVAKKKVETGEISALGIEVAGLQAGEWIATAGVNTLREGQKVRIQQ